MAVVTNFLKQWRTLEGNFRLEEYLAAVWMDDEYCSNEFWQTQWGTCCSKPQEKPSVSWNNNKTTISRSIKEKIDRTYSLDKCESWLQFLTWANGWVLVVFQDRKNRRQANLKKGGKRCEFHLLHKIEML